MKPIMQTDTTFKTGNCGEACIASILEIKLSEIPSLYNSEDVIDSEFYCTKLRNFLDHYGLGYVDLAMNKNHKPEVLLSNCWVIVTGPSPRATEEWHRHAVVWRNGNIIHDPHPSNAGLATIDTYRVFIAKDPAALQQVNHE